jgi:hypothetical protein
MSDLYSATSLFETSTRLQSASIALARLSTGDPLDDRSGESLVFAGRLLGQIPWEQQPGVSGGLTVEATQARPSFLASLRKIRPQMLKEGLKEDEQIFEFLAQLNKTLKSGGRDKALGASQIRLAASLLHELAHDLLMRLSQGRQGTSSPLRL